MEDLLEELYSSFVSQDIGNVENKTKEVVHPLFDPLLYQLQE